MADYSPTSAQSDMLLQKMHLTKRWVTSQTLAGHDTPPVASCSFSPNAFTQTRSPLVVDTNISSPISQLADRLTQHSLGNSTPRRVLAFSDEDDSPNSSGLADASVVGVSCIHAGFVLSVAECSAVGIATEQPTEARGRCPSQRIVSAAVSFGDYLSEDDGDDIAFAAASPAPSSVFEREPEADSRDSGVDSNDARRFGGAKGPASVVGPTEFTMPLAPAPRKASVIRDADHNKMTVDDGFEDMDKMVMEEETVDLSPSERLAAEQMLRRPPVVNIVKSTPPIRFGLRDVTNSDFSAHHESPKSSKFPFINQRKSGVYASKPGAIFGHTRKRAKLPSPPASLTTTPSAPEGKKRKHSVASSSPMQMETLKIPTDDHPSFSRSMSASVLEGVERESAEHMELRMQQKQVQYSLPTVSNPQIPSAAFKSINGHTLVSLISSMSPEEFNDKYFLVDCRFPYEYSGGHIRHATNIYDVEKVQSIFFPDENTDGRPQSERHLQFLRMRSRIPIFYCEFSQKRGPTMAHAVRHHDRARNEDRYPDLDYEEMYVLDRGYRKFFVDDKLKEFCDPSDYVQMRGKDHQSQLKMFTKSKSFSGSISGRPGLMSRSTKKLSFRPFVASVASNR